nr:putative transcription factor [Quercus suber]
MEPESTPVKATHARSTRSSIMKKKHPNSERDATPSKRVKKKDPDPEPKSQGGAEEKKLFQRLWSDDNEIELLKGMLDYRAIHDSDPAANGAAFYEFVKKSLHVEVTKAQLVDKMKRLRKKYSNNAGRGKKERLIKKGLELIGQQKRLELEERWKRVELAELQMYVTQAELIRDQASLILEAYKGQRNLSLNTKDLFLDFGGLQLCSYNDLLKDVPQMLVCYMASLMR